MVGLQGTQGGAGRDTQATEDAISILFVCTGNLCRSPTAQFLLATELGGPHPGSGAGLTDSRHQLPAHYYQLSSCGTRTVPGLPMDELSAAELRRRGHDPSDFRSTQLTESRVAAADLILTATRSHRSLVLEREPRGLGRTFTMLEFAALLNQPGGPRAESTSAADLIRSAAAQRWRVSGSEIDVPDPRGQPAAVHRATADQLQEAMSVIGVGLPRALGEASGRAVT